MSVESFESRKHLLVALKLHQPFGQVFAQLTKLSHFVVVVNVRVFAEIVDCL